MFFGKDGTYYEAALVIENALVMQWFPYVFIWNQTEVWINIQSEPAIMAKLSLLTLKDRVLLVQQYKSKEYFAKPIHNTVMGCFYLLFQKIQQLWKVIWAVLTYTLIQGNLVELEGKARDFFFKSVISWDRRICYISFWMLKL